MSGIGHNSGDAAPIADSGSAADEIKQFVARLDRLEEEKQTTVDDIKDVYAELKARGFDVKAMREIMRVRKQDPDKRKELNAVVELYATALGISDLFA